MLHVTCHILHARNALHSVLSSFKYNYVTCQPVTCNNYNMSHFTCHMSYITCPWKCHACMHAFMSAFILCHISTCHMSCVTCHMSLVTCHMSQVMCHMSHVIFHMFLDMLCIVQSPWCWPNKMTIYRAPRQPKRSKIKKWSSSVPRPDTQNENELWILIY